MARTNRNRSAVPKDWTVRDNGRLYHNGNDEWGRKLCETGVPRPKYRRSQYRCEQTWARRQDNRKYRNWANHLTRTGNWDDIVPQTRTSGWLSW
jgi:hypothetical protein